MSLFFWGGLSFLLRDANLNYDHHSCPSQTFKSVKRAFSVFCLAKKGFEESRLVARGKKTRGSAKAKAGALGFFLGGFFFGSATKMVGGGGKVGGMF